MVNAEGHTRDDEFEWEEVPCSEPLEERRRTSVGNSERLLDRHWHDIRFVSRIGKWMVWDGRRFLVDEADEVTERAKETALSIYDEARAHPDTDIRKALAAWAVKTEGEHLLREMVSLARSDPRVRVKPEELDANPWYLTVENGTIDLRRGVLLPHSRRDLITKLATVTYDPNATCPTWLHFLNKILAGDDELVGFLQRAVGYTLTGDTREQVLFFLHGSGQNGKTTLIEAVLALLGDYGEKAAFGTFLEGRSDGRPRNDLAGLQGARFVPAVEASDGHRLDEGLVKQVTGGDTIAARYLYGEFFRFRPQFKLWLAANHKPVIRGTDLAIWRRIRLVPFTVTIAEEMRDPDLPAKLQAELPGILLWAVDGCQAWLRNGLGTPPAVHAATEGWRSDSDVLAAFLEECCELGPGNRVGAMPLFQAYESWCQRSGEPGVAQRAFGQSLRERGFTKVRGGRTGSAVWHGIGILRDLMHTDPSFGNSPTSPPTRELTGRRVTKGQIPQERSFEREAEGLPQ